MPRGYLLLLSILCGCSSAGAPGPAVENEVPAISWPPAPSQARIEYLRQFSVPEDLGLRRPFGRKLRNWLAGDDDRGMVRPYAITGSQDRLVVADPDSGTVHIFDIRGKNYRTLTRAGKQDFRSPIGVALGEDRLFISDSVLKRVFILDKRYKLQETIEGFERPTGIAFDPQSQRLYVVDTAAHLIRVFDREGKELLTIGERGTQDGQFNYPSHLAIIAGDRLIVNDTMNFRIQLLSLDGEYLGGFGKHGMGSGYFSQSKGVAADPDGHVYVADARANWVQVFNPGGELLLVFGSRGTAPGAFNMPAGLAFVGNTLYVADSFNRRIQVFRFLPEEP